MPPPNVVLINCDDLGYGDLGCYGSTINRTPALDRMAAEGARFTDFYQASPVCSASRAALLTGCYPLRIGFGGKEGGGLGGVLFPGWPIGLDPNEITIADALRDAGYATIAIGKWHCGDQPDFLPTNHGFDEWYGIPYSNDMGRQRPGVDEPSEEDMHRILTDLGVTMPWLRPPLPLMEGTEVVEQQPDQASLTGRYVERAVRFLRRSHADGAPFFLYLAHLYVHLPIYVQQRFLDESGNGPYGGAVAAIDWATSVLLHELKTLGIDEDTIVIFTSDNGALAADRGGSGSNRPLRGAKGTTWEGGQRVPGLVRWPGRIAPGTVVTEWATSMDLFPTLADLCGAETPAGIDGVRIGGLLGLGTDRPEVGRAFVYIQDGSLEAIRIGRWKLHVRKRRREVRELYDLVDDIGERTDLGADHPDVVARLEAALDEARQDLGDEATGVAGAGVRPIGRVAEARTVTEFDPDHPYFQAEYDLPHRG